MRILTRIKLLTAFTAVAILVLGMSLAWAYAGFARMQHDVTLISALQSSYFNRSLVRDLYFKFGEPHLVEKWEHEKAITDDLLRQVLEQIQDADQSQQLTSISNSINEGDALFQRIVENNRELQAHQETRALYEENDLRLSSQMLVRAALVRDDLLLLEESERKKLDRSLMLLTVATVLFAAALSTSTILVLSFAGRVFSRRLAALHAGARIIAGGNLGYRIEELGRGRTHRTRGRHQPHDAGAGVSHPCPAIGNQRAPPGRGRAEGQRIAHPQHHGPRTHRHGHHDAGGALY